MPIPKSIFRPFLLLFPIILTAAICNPVTQTLVPTATPTPTPTLTPSPAPTASPTLATVPDTGWSLLQPGLERRLIRLYDDQNKQVEMLYMLRLDQSQFRLDVAFHENPRNLEQWQAETNALVVVNGGYFRVENERHLPNGLTIVNGQAFGSSYESFAGMLAISEYGAELRWLAQQPYDPSEPLQAALQSFPLLVKPGGEPGFPAEKEDNLKARRTVVGQDREGRILFIVAPQGYFTLHQLSAYLTGSDLNLNIALNLDGGPSSGILLAQPQEGLLPYTALPFVILVYAR
ncbi:MAG: phosphodiester glycosidase family protein [Anaerolineales bacterium]